MNVAKSANMRSQKGAIIAEIAKRVTSDSDMDGFAAQVRRILGEDFTI